MKQQEKPLRATSDPAPEPADVPAHEAIELCLRIRGRVQGVGYRESLRAAAVRESVAGWVRNRGDGSVEAVLVGRQDACRRVIDWARQGPPLARVEQVEVRRASAAQAALAGSGFDRLPTL